MSPIIFIRERKRVEKGEKKPRFRVVAVAGADLQFGAHHVRRQEVDQVAGKIGAEVVELKAEKGKEIHA